MAVRVTLVDTGEDFNVGPDVTGRDRELSDRTFMHVSRTPQRGRFQLECREHDHSDDPDLMRRRGPDRRVRGILVYLRKRHEGEPTERWEVVHFDGSATHSATHSKSERHQREQDEWCAAGSAAGYPADQEQKLPGGGVADVLILGPALYVDVEVQRCHPKRRTVLGRTTRNTSPGIAPLWSTDRLTDWNRDNAVPNIRTNELPEGHSPRDRWQVVGGVRDVHAEHCTARVGGNCPSLGRGRYCGGWHPRLLPPERPVRVYEVAETFPGGGLVVLEAGKLVGRPLVTVEHRDLYAELTGSRLRAAPIPRSRVHQEPGHRIELRDDFGRVIDANLRAYAASSPTSACRLERALHRPRPCPRCRRESTEIVDGACLSCRAAVTV